MPDIITTPVELGFSEFVAKLISDTFEAIITSSAKQEEDWMQLNDLLQLGEEEFAKRVIDDDNLLQEVIRLFPDDKGGTVIVVHAKYQKANPDKGIPESPPIASITGFQPEGKVLLQPEVNKIFEAVRVLLASRQYEILRRMFARGTTKVIVDAGKINAKLTFEITQVEDESAPGGGSGGGISPVGGNKIFVKRRSPAFRGITKPIEMERVHFFVKPPSDKDPQTSTVKANIYSEVEIQFKTIT
jgi:hypothetical protein